MSRVRGFLIMAFNESNDLLSFNVYTEFHEVMADMRALMHFKYDHKITTTDAEAKRDMDQQGFVMFLPTTKKDHRVEIRKVT